MSDASNSASTGPIAPNFEKLEAAEKIFAPAEFSNNMPAHEIDADKGTDATTGAGDAAPAGSGTGETTGRGST